MSAKLDIYTCGKRGNVAEFLTDISCTPEGCSAPIQHTKDGAADEARINHAPVISKIKGGCKVTAGPAAYSVTEAHLVKTPELSTNTGIFVPFQGEDRTETLNLFP